MHNLALPPQEEKLALRQLSQEEFAQLYPELCPNCRGFLSFTYQNNGFTSPDPERWEQTHAHCDHCGWDSWTSKEEVL